MLLANCLADNWFVLLIKQREAVERVAGEQASLSGGGRHARVWTQLRRLKIANYYEQLARKINESPFRGLMWINVQSRVT